MSSADCQSLRPASTEAVSIAPIPIPLTHYVSFSPHHINQEKNIKTQPGFLSLVNINPGQGIYFISGWMIEVCGGWRTQHGEGDRADGGGVDA